MIKPRIGIYGRMNVGKSSLLNYLTGQDIAIVSALPGTTTDPVRRTFEILNFAPVIFIDTAGFDDKSEIGIQRVQKTVATLSEVDLAILVVDNEVTAADDDFLKQVTSPYFVVSRSAYGFTALDSELSVIDSIKQAIPLSSLVEPPFFGTRLSKADIVLLVCPIDSEAPSGRLILPQVQAIRAALDAHAIAIMVQPAELPSILKKVMPQLIVTDSQAFGEITELIPQGIELTSFSILLSELKGDPQEYTSGLEAVAKLKTGDTIVLIEHCSHQSSCEDIARIKIPKLMQQKLGLNLKFDVRRELPALLDNTALIVQCGGCMVGRRSVVSNIAKAQKNCVHITNYGMLLRHLHSM